MKQITSSLPVRRLQVKGTAEHRATTTLREQRKAEGCHFVSGMWPWSLGHLHRAVDPSEKSSMTLILPCTIPNLRLTSALLSSSLSGIGPSSQPALHSSRVFCITSASSSPVGRTFESTPERMLLASLLTWSTDVLAGLNVGAKIPVMGTSPVSCVPCISSSKAPGSG